jgi:uncharacterized protein (TIGR02266 family)
MIEKRKYLRIPFDAPMYGKIRFVSEIKDISISGCFVQTATPLTEGTYIDLEFTLPNTARIIRAKGEVRWYGDYSSDHRTELSKGVGIRFAEMSLDDIAIITEFVKERASHERKFARSNIAIPIKFSKEKGKYDLDGEALDISLGGLFIKSDTLVDLDDTVHIQLTFPEQNDPIICKGKVVYINRDIPSIFQGMIHPGMGIEFVDIPEDALEKIDQALDNPL